MNHSSHRMYTEPIPNNEEIVQYEEDNMTYEHIRCRLKDLTNHKDRTDQDTERIIGSQRFSRREKTLHRE